MLSALLLQLLAQIENGGRTLEQLHEYCSPKQRHEYCRPKPPTSDMLFDSLRSTIGKLNVSYIFLDGIDETESRERTDLLRMIQNIRGWNIPNFHLLISSRDEYDIRHSLQSRVDQNVSMRNHDHDQDIAIYVSYKLSNDPDLHRWHRRHTEIKDALLMKAQGL
jgi:hypothetical protein